MEMCEENGGSESSEAISVGFVSLGCAKNLVDSQLMAGNLIAGNLTLAPSPEEADVILVNTCAFIEDAREEAAESIHWACSLKEAEGPVRAVIVAGCMSQRYRERLYDAFPDIDAVMGLDELESVAGVVRRAAYGEKGILEVSEISKRVFRPRFPGLIFTGGPFAYLKVAEGCSHGCAFCAIPSIRGKHRSRTMAELVDESKALVAQGIGELAVISQDITSFGRDRRSENASLPALLRKLDAIDGDFRIRLLYGYPTFVSDELLDVMAGSSHICHYLDVPIQHSHPDILRAMCRADTITPVQELVGRIRGRMPSAAVRTTCLVGFPGETDAHFEHLMQFVAETGFDHLGAFVYSPEEGTPAWDLPDLPDLEIAEERYERLMTLQQKIVSERLESRKGNESVVMLEQPNAEEPLLWDARSEQQAPEVDGVTLVQNVPDEAESGGYAKVRITGCRDYDSEAVFVSDASGVFER